MSRFFKHNPNEVIFRQQPDGTFTSKCGYVIREVPRATSDEDIAEWKSKTVWQLTNPEGEVIDSCDFGIHLNMPNDKLIRRVYVNHNRNRVTWSPAHFTKGTVVQIDETISFSENGTKEFIVDHLIQNGPDSYCIQTAHVHPNPILEGDLIGFHISHVKAIVKRPPGVVKIRKDCTPAPDVNNTGKYVSINQLLSIISTTVECNAASDAPGTCFDAEKLLKRLKTMGLIKREVTTVRGFTGEEYTMMANQIKRREAIKFIRKNPHWCRETVKAAVAADQAMWEDHYQCDELELV